MTTLTVYVPAPGSVSETTIDRGSAIVGGTPSHDPGFVVIDYEGNRYNAENLRTFDERLLHAAERHLTRYPTVARRTLHEPILAEQFIEVGTYDTDTRTFTPTDEVARGYLERWLA